MNQDFMEIKDDLIRRRQKILDRLYIIDLDRRKTKGPLEQDLDDQAISLENDEVLDTLDDINRNELRKINWSLVRMENGGYGYCTVCKGIIKMARLRTLPFTSECLECAQFNEQNKFGRLG